MEIVTKSAEETYNLGEKIGGSLVSQSVGNDALVIGLDGELGSGKTTFTQGIAKGLGIETHILSPTFIIVRHYPVQKLKYSFFYHIDLYRLSENKQEYEDLGLTEIFSDPLNFVVVEWFEKVKWYGKYFKESISFKVLNENERKITFYK